MVIAHGLSLDEFLATEETTPYCEFVDGEVVEKPTPGPDHGFLVAEPNRLIGNHLSGSREGRVATELRHLDRAGNRVCLPDVSVHLRHHFPTGQRRGPVESRPDMVIEVLSPDDQTGRVIEKVQFYLRLGVPITWVVDPEGEAVVVYRPGAEPDRFVAGSILGAEPVLVGFGLDLSELFSVLHDDPPATATG